MIDSQRVDFVVEKVDFVSVLTQDIGRAKRFYGGTLGLPIETEGENDLEFTLGQVTLDVFDPASIGRPFARSSAGIAIRVGDVAAARAELETKGVAFEGETRFPDYGIGLQVLWPGQPNGMYHSESVQEDFLVVAGECLLLIEGEERRLRAWDFVHCPDGTEHIFVGAGSGPCVIVMAGSRAEHTIRYPVSELAGRHGASVEVETGVPKEAYARFPPHEAAPAPDGVLPSLHPPQ